MVIMRAERKFLGREEKGPAFTPGLVVWEAALPCHAYDFQRLPAVRTNDHLFFQPATGRA